MKVENVEHQTACKEANCSSTPEINANIRQLQLLTVGWMLVEVFVSLYAARKARSPVLLAFGSDSVVELLSGVLVLMTVSSRVRLSEKRASRLAGILLFALAAIVTLTAVFSLARHIETEASFAGMAITALALVVMPILAWKKRNAAELANNRALVADAAQSAACAYLAGVALLGLAANALFHVHWIDATAALVIVPLLVMEGRRALRGESCSNC